MSESDAKVMHAFHDHSQGTDHCGHLSHGDQDELSIVSSQMGYQQEKDDDSEYFVRILLDYTFTKHLNDPQFITPDVTELASRLDEMPKNAIFLDIIMNEIDSMFNQKFLLRN